MSGQRIAKFTKQEIFAREGNQNLAIMTLIVNCYNQTHIILCRLITTTKEEKFHSHQYYCCNNLYLQFLQSNKILKQENIKPAVFFANDQQKDEYYTCVKLFCVVRMRHQNHLFEIIDNNIDVLLSDPVFEKLVALQNNELVDSPKITRPINTKSFNGISSSKKQFFSAVRQVINNRWRIKNKSIERALKALCVSIQMGNYFQLCEIFVTLSQNLRRSFYDPIFLIFNIENL